MAVFSYFKVKMDIFCFFITHFSNMLPLSHCLTRANQNTIKMSVLRVYSSSFIVMLNNNSTPFTRTCSDIPHNPVSNSVNISSSIAVTTCS